MLLYRELFRRLKGGFHPAWSYRACCGLLVALDLFGFIGLLWYFLLRAYLAIPPMLLTRVAAGYLLLVLLLIFIALKYGRLVSVRVATMFYLSVGLFFLLAGVQEGRGLEIPVWPWIFVWIVTLGVLLVNFMRELVPNENETPRK